MESQSKEKGMDTMKFGKMHKVKKYIEKERAYLEGRLEQTNDSFTIALYVSALEELEIAEKIIQEALKNGN